MIDHRPRRPPTPAEQRIGRFLAASLLVAVGLVVFAAGVVAAAAILRSLL